MYNSDTMATHIYIDEGLDYWQSMAETANRLADAQPNKQLPHNNKELYATIHDADRTHWIKAIGVAKRLYQQTPSVFDKSHKMILDEVEFLIFQDYPNLEFNKNPLDFYYRYKTNQQKHQGKYLSKWGFHGLTMFREVWNNCNAGFTGNNGGKGPNRNHRPPTQSPAPQFNKLFNVNQPKGEKCPS